MTTAFVPPQPTLQSAPVAQDVDIDLDTVVLAITTTLQPHG